MAYRETTFTEFEGHIDGFTQKAIRFKAASWADYEWVPRSTKAGDPILEVVRHDHDNGEAVLKIADWICEKNGWEA